MSAERIAVRYAKPILELAEEKKLLDQVKEDMDSFLSICKESSGFSLMLKSPIIPHKKKAEILKKAFAGKYNDLTLQAFDLLTRKNRESLLEQVAGEFVALYDKMKGISKVSVTTTFALDDKVRKSILKLAKDITGKDPVLDEKVDKEILGGYIMKVDDKQIDDSVRGRLNELKLKFSKK